jgi:hypothetical protein
MQRVAIFLPTILFAILAAGSSAAKEIVVQVIDWPATGSPVVHVTLGKFKEISSISSQRTYVSETIVKNMWNKKWVSKK